MKIKLNQFESGKGQLILIAGPCVIESEDICIKIAEEVKNITEKLGIFYVFKASYDKANRTSVNSFRGPGIHKGLEILNRIRDRIKSPILSDCHTSEEITEAGKVLDAIQIPAFLCRQTDMLIAAAKTGKMINIKKGQFLAPNDMKNAIEKVTASGNDNVCLTERGASFGYNNLVVDFRSLAIMRQFAPVIFDATHSVQLPGGMGTSSGGEKQYIPHLARAAAAVGVDGFFMEVHFNPEQGLSDKATMFETGKLEKLLKEIVAINNIQRGA